MGAPGAAGMRAPAQSRPSTPHGAPRARPRVNQLFVLLGIESWKPVLTALMLPPVPLIVLMLIGARLILPRRGIGWLVIVLSATLMWLSCTAGAGRLLAQAMLRPPAVLNPARVAELKARVQAKEPIAIVVLGGGLKALAPEYAVSSLSDVSLERLRYGLWLQRETGAPLAFSGGVGWADDSGTPEAQIAARIAAQEFGRTIKWIEDQSRDTRDNAARSLALLKPQGITTIVLVTHDRHARRALRAFEAAAQGAVRIEAAPIGTLAPSAGPRGALAWLPSSEGFATVRSVLREGVGVLLGA
jgi:uncharacterized SAM-binding protein YcdF (DUF218 family)